MTTLDLILIVAVVALLIAIPVVAKMALARKSRQDAEKIGTAEEKARSIIDEAIKQAETKKRESMIEIQENSLRARNEVEKELKERRAEISKQERRIQSKEDTLDKKTDAMEKLVDIICSAF